MEVLCSVICQSYSSNPYNVNGVTGFFESPSVPCDVSFCIVLLLQGNPSEYGKTINLGLRVLDEDAKTIWQLYDPVTSKFSEEQPIRFAHAGMNANVTVHFVKFGEYVVCIDVDGQTIRQLPLDLRHRP